MAGGLWGRAICPWVASLLELLFALAGILALRILLICGGINSLGELELPSSAAPHLTMSQLLKTVNLRLMCFSEIFKLMYILKPEINYFKSMSLRWSGFFSFGGGGLGNRSWPQETKEAESCKRFQPIDLPSLFRAACRGLFHRLLPDPFNQRLNLGLFPWKTCAMYHWPTPPSY